MRVIPCERTIPVKFEQPSNAFGLTENAFGPKDVIRSHNTTPVTETQPLNAPSAIAKESQ